MTDTTQKTDRNAAIIRAWQSGQSRRDISALFGVSPSRVQEIVSNAQGRAVRETGMEMERQPQ